MGFKSSKDLTAQYVNFVMYGPPGSGKTFVAGTASEYWPDELPEVGKGSWVELSDMVWWGVDAGATDGFGQYKLNVPSYFDWSSELSSVGNDVSDCIRVALRETKSVIEKLAKDNIRPWIVVDTVSMLDRYFSDYYETKSSDSYSLYRNMLNAHKRVYTSLSVLPCNKIYLMHSKAQAMDDGKVKDSRRAKSILGEPIYPDVTGQASVIYVGNSSLEAVVLVTSSGGSNPVYSRKIYPMGGKGFEGKTRWEGILNQTEPPNIRKLLQKVRDHLA